jgi:hypothetical protein
MLVHRHAVLVNQPILRNSVSTSNQAGFHSKLTEIDIQNARPAGFRFTLSVLAPGRGRLRARKGDVGMNGWEIVEMALRASSAHRACRIVFLFQRNTAGRPDRKGRAGEIRR